MKHHLLLGTRKGLVVYQRQNGGWKLHSAHFTGIPVTLADIDQHGSWWAMLDHGHWGTKIHRSDDQGASWQELKAPRFEAEDELKPGVPATVKYLWAFASGGPSYPDRVWIGTEPGGLFISENRGESFELVRSLWDFPGRADEWFGGGRDNAGIHSILVDPRNNDHVHIGISCAGVLASRDSGKTWVALNKGLKADFLPDPDAAMGHDPHMLVRSTGHPDVLWQQNHCGIFRSTDNGQQWQDVSQSGGPAHFGFAITAAADDPEKAWVVPAVSDEIRVACDLALCVSATSDGGKTWSAGRSGLPQENAFDIVFRHALDLDQRELVFGTTTGNLYHSADSGQHWTALSTNLPLIHSACFV